MEAVTDVVFRHVVTQAGRPDVFFTEFTNATGWYRAGDKAIGGRLIKTDGESPIVAQLWGSDPEAMAAMSGYCHQLGYDGIDINMGCPDQSAVKAGGGAGMIRTPEKAWAIIEAAKSAGLPVSVKTRLGYSSVDEWREWLGGLSVKTRHRCTVKLPFLATLVETFRLLVLLSCQPGGVSRRVSILRLRWIRWWL